MNELNKNTVAKAKAVEPVKAVKAVEPVEPAKAVKTVKEPFDVVSGAEGKLRQKLNNLYNEKGDFEIVQFARNLNQNVAIIRYK